ncbi:MAG: hypothetical protein UW87_C0042G0006 [Candidatus Moranbacteria bacterium GW2011_GWC2_45_10]|nr:MAG: hypothetical protein UW87_C0042G0006 [Candidatus Moranbacteria bacterium GW2011_GWC2_45_10]
MIFFIFPSLSGATGRQFRWFKELSRTEQKIFANAEVFCPVRNGKRALTGSYIILLLSLKVKQSLTYD